MAIVTFAANGFFVEEERYVWKLVSDMEDDDYILIGGSNYNASVIAPTFKKEIKEWLRGKNFTIGVKLNRILQDYMITIDFANDDDALLFKLMWL